MPSIHNIHSKQILRFLLREGFEVCHQKGSHVSLKKENFVVTVPDHGTKTLRVKTTLSILKQSGFTKEYFLERV